MRGWSACCLSPLPEVRSVEEGPHGEYGVGLDPAIEAFPHCSSFQKLLLRTRAVPLIDYAEREARRSRWWDSRLFLLGFGGSLIVTIVIGIMYANYISDSSREVITGISLVLSSIGTASMGLRERLKFKEMNEIDRRFSSKAQRKLMLFLARASPYDALQPDDAFRHFMQDFESLKSHADEDRLSLRDAEDRASDTLDALATQLKAGGGGHAIDVGLYADAGGFRRGPE